MGSAGRPSWVGKTGRASWRKWHLRQRKVSPLSRAGEGKGRGRAARAADAEESNRDGPWASLSGPLHGAGTRLPLSHPFTVSVYFCLDSQAGWVKIFSHLSPSSPTEHAAAAGPQLPVFLHPAQDERGHGTVRALTPRLPAPRAAGSCRSGCEGRKVPRASLGPLPSWAFLTCAPSQVARRHQAWETAPDPRLHLGGQPEGPPDGPCDHIVLNTMVFQK